MALPSSGTGKAVWESTIAAESSSVTATGSVAVTDPYSPPLAVCVSVALPGEASSSWSALTLTVCARSQFDGVNVSWLVPSVSPAVPPAAIVTFTLALGSVASATV